MTTVKEVISGTSQLSYNTFKDNGYRFFKPLLDVCMAYEGSGDQEDEDTVFVAVIIPPSTDKTALIMTTRRAHDRKSLEIQNIETLLSSKHSINNVSVIYSHPKDIHAILHDANSKKGKGEKSEADETHSAALQDLENIVTEAVVTGTSDIHFYVYEDRAEAVFRIDGLFSQRTPLGREQAISIIAAGLNTKSPDYRSVTDDNEMADVSIYMNVEVPDPKGGQKPKREKINLRTSKSGSLEGPHTVMRVIRTSQEAKKTISDLGMDSDIRSMLVRSTEAPTGIILLTGPTGSGKSTTLAALYETIDEERKILLLEDPVEYRIKRKNTVQKPVFPEVKGQGFIDHLKNALRQDPDIIGISEMRSKEVVEIVIKSALTGHLMVSTLHTNDAIGGISRLIDEGVSPKVLAERNLFRCIVAQRLIPALCPKCRVKKSVEGFANSYVRSEHGCKHCGGTGTKGRVLIAELIMFDDKCREYIANHNLAALEKHLLDNGWKGMAARARMRIEQGVIDPYEAVKHVTNLFAEESAVKYPEVEFVNIGLEPA
ncbi:ATPase, T2SS/T4P/T4SS family [Pseudoalteromonas agarivorans]|uniref:GspE/PulE family protein n=1 Tax=Pseudoalteromonas agarivorans TaxID=176102 RepID=UPI0021175EF0|nr:ATPase, T2SS/T4P/T4SS family [Pseudoalteromonas agarivorans]MCQ8822294.1 ATPase, T2SS/T4P/T4SS family [Pseudoalteromonas agarivorans]